VTARLLSEANAKELSQALSFIRAMRAGGLTSGPFGLGLTPSESASLVGTSGVQRARFKVVSVHTDYLTCNTYDGTTTGTEDIYVAMPWDLRRTPFDGQTVNSVAYTYSSDTARVATSGSRKTVQRITDPYFAGCEIWAFRATGGGTSVTVSSDGLTWQDMNVSGRRWDYYPSLAFGVTVTKTGGSDGTNTTAASWVYTVAALDGTTLGTSIAVARTRPNGSMTYGTGYGLAFYAADGTLKLWDAGENPATAVCS
jgi:hypothetical protein